MLILLGLKGGLSWANTSKFYKAYYKELYAQRWVGGIGASDRREFDSLTNETWPAFRCFGCTRILPVDCADLDHVSPKSKISHQVCLLPNDRHFGSRTSGWNWDIYSKNCQVNTMGGELGVVSEGALVAKVIDFVIKDNHYIQFDRNELMNKAKSFYHVPTVSYGPHQAGPPIPPPLPSVHGVAVLPGTKRTSIMSDLEGPSAKRKVLPGIAKNLVTLRIAEVIMNDMENLMLLCPHCNRTKSSG